jgi:ribose 5-phosphate isomerase RpiB
VHDIGVVWHACDQPGCKLKFKVAGNLKAHKASVHDIGVVWHACDQPGCEHKSKLLCNLKAHKENVHNLGDVVWHACDQPDCEFKTKQAAALKQHKANVHNIGSVWYACDQPGCEHKSKLLHNLKVHKANKHDIGVEWHACDQPGCEYKTKIACSIKIHKACMHDIGVVWHACDVDPDKCKYKSKTSKGLHEHIRRMHSRVYAQRRKEQEERVRAALRDAGWQEHRLAEAMPPVGFFRREKRIDFKCAKLESRDTWANIDFVLGVPNGFVFLEVDENQHKYGYGDHLSCDMKRMACVMESLAVETNYSLPNLYWLRYNPNAWHVAGDVHRILKADREANLVAWLGAFECNAPFGIGYAFYDCEAPDEEDGAPGMLDVLGNPEYNPKYAEAVDNLMDLSSVYHS